MSDLDRLTRLRDEALRDLEQASGGAPLCRVSATGTQGQTIKYFEGRYAVLTELLRADRELWASIATAWEERLGKLQSERAGKAWIMYSSGGVDALCDVGLLSLTRIRADASSAQTREQ